MQPTRDDLRPERSGGVSLWYIATRAGISDRSDQWILNYVRMLCLDEGFPDPLPNFTLGGKRREGIVFSSRWLRDAVDAWFVAFMPAELVAVMDERQLREDADKLDQRAEALTEGRGRPGLPPPAGAGARPAPAIAAAGGMR